MLCRAEHALVLSFRALSQVDAIANEFWQLGVILLL